jgi:coenzyme F420 biosynthesis associated uncharacterized protein
VIDWILAERLAAYVAGDGGGRKAPVADLAALAIESERRVAAYTGLSPVSPLPSPEGIGRREWVRSNVAVMRAMLDPLVEKAGKGMGPMKPAAKLAIGIALTLEVGIVVGYLGQRVLGQYELVLLDATDAPPRLLFVLPNLAQAVEAFGADEHEFMTWVALHEVTHAVQFGGVPWLQPHLSGLLKEMIARAEVRLDTSGKRRRLRMPSAADVRRVAGTLRHGDFITLVTTADERETLDRIQATMAVVEGHAEHVMDAVAPDLLPSLPRLRASLDRRRQTQSSLSRIVARLLGLELKMRQYEQGKAFCDAIVAARGPDALAHVFTGPEALPSMAEIADPSAWLARVGL